MLDHIAIATKSPEKFIEMFKKLGFEYKGKELIEKEKVNIYFLAKNSLKIELLEPLDDSKINDFINKRGETFHHLAISVENISKEINNLKNFGFNFVNEIPKEGGEGKKIAFIHPKSSFGILIELVEKKNES